MDFYQLVICKIDIAMTSSTILRLFALDEPDSQNDLHEAYSHVKTILFFIGYPRSRHSLLGSLLDAHPRMVVSDETMAFPRWRRNPKQWTNGSIYAFYDSLFSASQKATMRGRRSRVFEGSVVNKTANYGYYVPNQWQGNYDRHIEVRTNIFECSSRNFGKIFGDTR